jgi:TetR/AcrR family transcriptional repressor of nem operon
MQKTVPTPRQPLETRKRLIAATHSMMLAHGYAATTVEQICTAAGVTKGSFFHHFTNKEAITQAAIDAWGTMGGELYAAAWANPSDDPLTQIDTFIDIMIAFASRSEQDCVCMIGMMSQELAATHPTIRSKCAGHLHTWTGMVEELLDRAKRAHPTTNNFSSSQVAWMLNSNWQGSMLIAKTCQQQSITVNNLVLARHYIHSLFIPK